MAKFEGMVPAQCLKAKVEKEFHKLNVKIKHILKIYKNEGVVMVVELSILI